MKVKLRVTKRVEEGAEFEYELDLPQDTESEAIVDHVLDLLGENNEGIIDAFDANCEELDEDFEVEVDRDEEVADGAI